MLSLAKDTQSPFLLKTNTRGASSPLVLPKTVASPLVISQDLSIVSKPIAIASVRTEALPIVSKPVTTRVIEPIVPIVSNPTVSPRVLPTVLKSVPIPVLSPLNKVVNNNPFVGTPINNENSQEMAGFFKKLGDSVKGVTKMIAIKNVGKVLSGDYLDLAGEAASRIANPFLAKGENPSTNAGVNIATASILAGARTAAGLSSVGVEMGKIGAQTVDNTITEWFKKHILHIVGVVTSVVILFTLWKKSNNPKTARRR